MIREGSKVKFVHWLFAPAEIEGVVEDTLLIDKKKCFIVKSYKDTINKPGEFYTVSEDLVSLEEIKFQAA